MATKHQARAPKQDKKVTVMVLDSRTTQSFQMSARLLSAIRPMLFGFAALSIFLAIFCVVLAGSYFKQRQQTIAHQQTTVQLQKQVADLKQATSDEIEHKVALLSQSEESLSRLQKYLRERGVKVRTISSEPLRGKPNDAAGGPSDEVFSLTVPYTGTFSDDIEGLLAQVRKVPLGRPHMGSISSRFGVRSNPFTGDGSERHTGLDFRAHTGEPIRSTADGRVVFSGYSSGYGYLVRVAHGYGYETYYAHLSDIAVRAGQSVKSGEVVGKAGSTGRSTGPHLHYEVRLNGNAINPENFLTLGK